MASRRRVTGKSRSKRDEDKRKDAEEFSDAEWEKKVEDKFQKVREVVLRRIGVKVPVAVRKKFPDGHADATIQGTSVLLTFKLIAEDGKELYVKSMYGVRPFCNELSPGKIGDHIVSNLVQEINYYVRDYEERYPEEPKAVPKKPGEKVTVVPADDATKVVLGDVEVDEKLEARKKKIKERGPDPCKICGDEDRTTFPAWGPCPHQRREK